MMGWKSARIAVVVLACLFVMASAAFWALNRVGVVALGEPDIDLRADGSDSALV